jgi:hypothetical protein
VREPEPLVGARVVAAPDVLDALLPLPEGRVGLRFAADDLFILGKSKVIFPEPGIVEDEHGFVGWWLTPDELAEHVLPHLEWPLPATRPALAQGLVAGVPAKIWLTEDRALLLCAAAYAHELVERLP